MKIRKRLLSLTLAVMLIVATAIPASAYTVAMGRQWSGFSYSTSDTCNLNGYSCVIEGASAEYLLRTDVDVYIDAGNDAYAYLNTYTGTSGTLIATNAKRPGRVMDHIECRHYIGGTYASYQWVGAS